MNEALVERTCELIKQPDTILYIGAGISRWSGLPSWTGLIEELANYIEQIGLSADLVRRELRTGDLLQAASFGIDKLTKPQFADFIKKACRLGKAVPHEVHKELVTLGPTCFVTTNYDQLIEDALHKWNSKLNYRVISNKQVTETADIVQARANCYVFKPHGDVNDSDTIVLTREQYRKLNAERPHILDAIKTLLVSRPILFLGYSLRDPDFMYVKDLILDIYKGGARDHYAIMADISEEEQEYWRRNYGLHILSYETHSGDHSEFMQCLNSIHPDRIKHPEPSSYLKRTEKIEFNASQILAIIRYCDRIDMEKPKPAGPELPLQVSLQRKYHRPHIFTRSDRYDNALVDEFLLDFDNNIILLGNPGAGKTYSLRKLCSTMASQLRYTCIHEANNVSNMMLPIYLDLSLYDGNIWNMAEQSLPSNFSLGQLLKQMKAKFVLDSFNEMPREYRESGHFEQDISNFLGMISGNILIIASRTDDGLKRLDFPKFLIEEIQKSYVEQSIRNIGYEIKSDFKRELLALLQKPLFYRWFFEGKADIGDRAHPFDFYKSVFRTLASDFSRELHVKLDFEDILAPVAFKLIQAGQETMPITEFLKYIKIAVIQSNNVTMSELDIANWLITKNLIVPLPQNRVRFFHQSLTEYLAARELARHYKISPEVLSDCLTSTRWDQALFLTLGFLSTSQTAAFMNRIVKTELDLAIRAAKFVEFEQDRIVTSILEAVERKSFINFFETIFTSMLLKDLPVSNVHIECIRKLMERHDSLGGAAAELLTKVLQREAMDELMNELLSHGDDYNFCSGVGKALANIVTEDDLTYIVSNLKDVTPNTESDTGLVEGFSTILKQCPVALLIPAFPSLNTMTKIQSEVICSVLEKSSDNQSVRALYTFLNDGLSDALFPFYMKLKYYNGLNYLDKEIINVDLLSKIVAYFEVKNLGDWAMDTVGVICSARPDLATTVRNMASQREGLCKLALLYCIYETKYDEFWHEMASISNKDSSTLEGEPIHLIADMRDLDWCNQVELLLKLLHLRNSQLARALLEPFFSTESPEFEVKLDDIEWWLEWMQEVINTEEGFWFVNRLSRFIANYGDSKTLKSIIKIFNESSKFRPLLADYLLPEFRDLSCDDLNEDAIEFLITDLHNPMAEIVRAPLIGEIATEPFVYDRLLPLINSEDDIFKRNLLSAVRAAGKRHNKRYYAEGGSELKET